MDLKGAAAVVTGASGFLGRRVVRSLLGREAQVLGLDIQSAEERRNYRHLTGPIKETLPEAGKFWLTVKPEKRLLIHLAAIADSAACADNETAAWEANVTLTELVAASAAKAGGVVMVFPSTGYVYGYSDGVPFTEEAPLRPAGFYARTKAAAEEALRDRALSLGGLVLARLSNVYGPGGSPNTVIGRITAQIKARQPIRVRHERPVRDFLFADDAATGLVALAGWCRKETTAVNLSTGRGVSIGRLAEMAAEMTGADLEPPLYNHEHEASRLVLACDRLKKITGWSPPTTLEQGLALTFEDES